MLFSSSPFHNNEKDEENDDGDDEVVELGDGLRIWVFSIGGRRITSGIEPVMEVVACRSGGVVIMMEPS